MFASATTRSPPPPSASPLSPSHSDGCHLANGRDLSHLLDVLPLRKHFRKIVDSGQDDNFSPSSVSRSDRPHVLQMDTQRRADQAASDIVPGHSIDFTPEEVVNSISSNLPVLVYFGMISYCSDTELLVESASPSFPGFPCLMSHVCSGQNLAQLQRSHFSLTYKHHGLSISDIVGYGAAFFDSCSKRYRHPKLCLTEADWRGAVAETIASHQTMCGWQERCAHRLNPAKIVVVFNKAKFNDALFARGIDPEAVGLTFLDVFNGYHASTLQHNDHASFLRYSRICEASRQARARPHLLFHEAVLNILKTSAPHTHAHLTNSSYLRNKHPEQAATLAGQTVIRVTETRPAEASTRRIIRIMNNPRVRPKLSTANGLDTICGPKGYRLIADDCEIRQIPPEAYLQASERPTSLTKRDSDSCLTCIHLGRKCRGTRLVRVNGTIRCQYCSKKHKSSSGGTRRCYWKDVARGILTYEDAKEADNTRIVNTGNTREAKRNKARQRLAMEEENTVKAEEQEGCSDIS